MTQAILPKASGVKPRQFSILLAAMALLALAYIGQMIFHWTGVWHAEVVWTSNSNGKTYRLGDKTFVVSEGLLRDADQTVKLGFAKEAPSAFNLEVVWPSMNGRRHEDVQQSEAYGKGSNHLEINVGVASIKETMRDRLKPVYRRLARGPEQAGPAGLRILTLSGNRDTRLDQVVFEPNSTNGFIARCKQANQKTVSMCESELQLPDGILVRYRFEQPLLANWGRLERRIVELIQSLEA